MTANTTAVAAGLLKRDELGNRVPGRKFFAQMQGERRQQHDRQAVRHYKPEQAANSPGIGDCR
jgi:hypothetical protein